MGVVGLLSQGENLNLFLFGFRIESFRILLYSLVVGEHRN